jgi:hypothetical protein
MQRRFEGIVENGRALPDITAEGRRTLQRLPASV